MLALQVPRDTRKDIRITVGGNYTAEKQHQKK